MLYLGTWEIFDNSRVACMTYFASMTPEDDEKESQGVKLIGRWSDAGTGSGTFICEADNYESIAAWLYNWSSMANITIKPICDDNTAREILLGKTPEYVVEYDNVDAEPSDAEVIFAINYKFLEDKKLDGQKAFAGLSKEQDDADSGDCEPLGRWHDLGTGSGYAVALAKSEKDIYAWANNWAGLCNCEIKPVLTDKQARKMISSKPDFDAKLTVVKASMAPVSLYNRVCSIFKC